MPAPWEKQDVRAYTAQLQRQQQEQRLLLDRAQSDRMVRDYFKSPSPECQAVLKAAGDAEDAGRLDEACNLYQKVLTREPDNLELRAYLNQLVARANAASLQKRLQLQQQHAAASKTPEQLSLPLPSAVSGGRVLARNGSGYGPPARLSPQLYAEQLKVQAGEDKRRWEAAKRAEEDLERKQMAASALQFGAAEHRQQVHGDNAKLQAAVDRGVGEPARGYGVSGSRSLGWNGRV